MPWIIVSYLLWLRFGSQSHARLVAFHANFAMPIFCFGWSVLSARPAESSGPKPSWNMFFQTSVGAWSGAHERGASVVGPQNDTRLLGTCSAGATVGSCAAIVAAPTMFDWPAKT